MDDNCSLPLARSAGKSPTPGCAAIAAYTTFGQLCLMEDGVAHQSDTLRVMGSLSQ